MAMYENRTDRNIKVKQVGLGASEETPHIVSLVRVSFSCKQTSMFALLQGEQLLYSTLFLFMARPELKSGHESNQERPPVITDMARGLLCQSSHLDHSPHKHGEREKHAHPHQQP